MLVIWSIYFCNFHVEILFQTTVCLISQLHMSVYFYVSSLSIAIQTSSHQFYLSLRKFAKIFEVFIRFPQIFRKLKKKKKPYILCNSSKHTQKIGLKICPTICALCWKGKNSRKIKMFNLYILRNSKMTFFLLICILG